MVLLAIAAIGIIWVYISAPISTISPKLSCTEIALQSPVKIMSACFNETAKEVRVNLKRSSDSQIDSLGFVVSQGANTSAWQCTDKCGDCVILKNLEVKEYYLSYEGTPDNFALRVNNCIAANIPLTACS